MIFLFIATGLLLIGLAVPLMRRRIRPNGLYGLRVPSAFADERVWYEANAASGRDLGLLGVVQLVVAIGLWFVPGIPPDVYAFGNAGILTLGALLCGAVGWRRANALLRERAAGHVEPDR